MKIAIGCDELGIEMKNMIISLLVEKNHIVKDFGVKPSEIVDYPEIGFDVAFVVSNNEFDRGILICGTGIGMAMTANKVLGIRAAVCHDIYSTQRSILSNDAQIMCLGSLIIGPAIAKELVSIWLDLEFVEGNSSRKISKIMDIERNHAL